MFRSKKKEEEIFKIADKARKVILSATTKEQLRVAHRYACLAFYVIVEKYDLAYSKQVFYELNNAMIIKSRDLGKKPFDSVKAVYYRSNHYGGVQLD